MPCRIPAALLLACLAGSSVALAGSYTGKLESINDKEVVINVKKDARDKEGEKKTFKLGKDAKALLGAAKKGDEPRPSTAADLAKALEEKKVGFAKVETAGEGAKEEAVTVTAFVKV